MVLHISSPRIQHLRLTFDFVGTNSRRELPPKNSVLGNIALEPIHNTIKGSHFDSLLDVTVSVDKTPIPYGKIWHITSDIALTKGELADQLRLLLQPWDKRGILTITNKYVRPKSRADPGDSDRIKDITPEDLHSNAHCAQEVGDGTSHVGHAGCTGHAEEDDACKGLGE